MAIPVITYLAQPLRDGIPPEVVDEIHLTSEERANAHFSTRTLGGREIRVSLPRGSELQDGDVLFRDKGLAIVVRASKERLLWLTRKDNEIEWCAACYQLGNLHRPARFLEGGVLTPYDPMALQMLCTHDISVREVMQPFIGRRFGAAGAHHAQNHENLPRHSHSHDHGHAHHHDHNYLHDKTTVKHE